MYAATSFQSTVGWIIFNIFRAIELWLYLECFYLDALKYEASRGAAARGVTVKPTGCGFDPHSRRWNIYLNLYFHFFALVSRQSAALRSATQHAKPPEFGRKLETECLNTRFPLPTLLCAGYRVKLIYFLFIFKAIVQAVALSKVFLSRCFKNIDLRWE